MFLQILDDGRATDGQGKTVDFSNAVLILTSNLGSRLILEEDDEKKMELGVMEEVRRHFRPEFLNRIDEIVIFSHLEKEQLKAIVGQYSVQLIAMLQERGITLAMTDEAENLICERGYDPDYGARPMKRVFQNEVQNPLATEILGGKYPPGTVVEVGVEKGELVFRAGEGGKRKRGAK